MCCFCFSFSNIEWGDSDFRLLVFKFFFVIMPTTRQSVSEKPEQNVIVNEILYFLWNQHQVCSIAQIVNVCENHFDNKDVLCAKSTLFSLIDSDLLTVRFRECRTISKNIEDIVNIFNDEALIDSSNLPLFVAHDLSKLPSLKPFHVDSTHLISNMMKMQSDMNDMSELLLNLRKEISDLKAEREVVKELRAESVESQKVLQKIESCMKHLQSQNDRAMSYAHRVRSPASQPMQKLPTSSQQSALRAPAALHQAMQKPFTPSQQSDHDSSSTVHLTTQSSPASPQYSTQESSAALQTSVPSLTVASTMTRSPLHLSPSASCATVPVTVTAPVHESLATIAVQESASHPLSNGVNSGSNLLPHPVHSPVEEPMTLGNSKIIVRPKSSNSSMGNRWSDKRNKPMCRIGAKKTGGHLSMPLGRKMVSVFVSRLRPECSVDDLRSWLKGSLPNIVSIDRLPARYDSYASFKCICLIESRTMSHAIESALDPKIWPEGSLVRRYFEPKPQEDNSMH